MPYRRKKLTFAISSPDEFLFSLVSRICPDFLPNSAAVCLRIGGQKFRLYLYVYSDVVRSTESISESKSNKPAVVDSNIAPVAAPGELDETYALSDYGPFAPSC